MGDRSQECFQRILGSKNSTFGLRVHCDLRSASTALGAGTQSFPMPCHAHCPPSPHLKASIGAFPLQSETNACAWLRLCPAKPWTIQPLKTPPPSSWILRLPPVLVVLLTLAFLPPRGLCILLSLPTWRALSPELSIASSLPSI